MPNAFISLPLSILIASYAAGTGFISIRRGENLHTDRLSSLPEVPQLGDRRLRLQGTSLLSHLPGITERKDRSSTHHEYENGANLSFGEDLLWQVLLMRVTHVKLWKPKTAVAKIFQEKVQVMFCCPGLQSSSEIQGGPGNTSVSHLAFQSCLWSSLSLAVILVEKLSNFLTKIEIAPIHACSPLWGVLAPSPGNVIASFQ